MGEPELRGGTAEPGARGSAGRRRRDGRPWRNRQLVATVLVVAAGGVVGALARDLVLARFPAAKGAIPWSTAAVNLSGSLLLGVLLTSWAERPARPWWLRPLLATGLLGAFTTFSTWMVEVVDLARADEPARAVLYTAGSVVGGLLAVTAGALIGRWLGRRRSALGSI